MPRFKFRTNLFIIICCYSIKTKIPQLKVSLNCMFYDYYPQVEDKPILGSTMMIFIDFLRKLYYLVILHYYIILKSRITLLIG
jgi:hypothetical protein